VEQDDELAGFDSVEIEKEIKTVGEEVS